MFHLPPEVFVIAEQRLTPSIHPASTVTMTDQNIHFDRFPAQLRVGSQSSATVFFKQTDTYSVHYADDIPTQARSLGGNVLEEEKIVVFSQASVSNRALTDALSTATEITPVYATQLGGSIAVPTGRVFIQFPEGDTAENHTDEISRAGYDISEQVIYAPHAAWLTPTTGRVEDGLGNLAGLISLPQVQSVEPQLLMESTGK